MSGGAVGVPKTVLGLGASLKFYGLTVNPALGLLGDEESICATDSAFMRLPGVSPNCMNKIPFQQGRTSGKWLKVEITAVNGSMAVVSTGATIFQANMSKLRRPLDTVDLEELPDSRDRAGACVLWLSCEGQIDFWDLFSDNSYLSAILDQQGLQVATQLT